MGRFCPVGAGLGTGVVLRPCWRGGRGTCALELDTARRKNLRLARRRSGGRRLRQGRPVEEPVCERPGAGLGGAGLPVLGRPDADFGKLRAVRERPREPD